MKNDYKLLLLLIFLFASNSELQAQTFIDKLTNFFEFDLGGEHKDTTHYQTKLVLSPVVSYEPATNVGFGLGAKFLFKPKKAGKETRTSNLPLSILYTLNNQFIFTSRYDVFFPQEKWLLRGNLSFSKFPVGYFGIGRNSLLADEIGVSFNQLLVQPLLLRQLKKHWFAGAGIRYLTSYGAKFQEEEAGPPDDELIESLNSRSLGLVLATTVDSRDNVLNATKGTLLEFTHGLYDKDIVSSNSYMVTQLDFRKYFRMNPEKFNMIAVGMYTRLTWNDPSLLELSTLGGAELLRGFQEGRFRDRFAYFTQVEYRWQTFRRIGFVFFGGAGDVMGKGQALEFDELKYSLGTGIRLKIVEKENLNIRFDYAFGFGDERESNFYLGIAEAF